MFNQPQNAMYTVGAAIEMIHTYSLIHDDLPCMDDDDIDVENRQIIKYLEKHWQY